ncbi:MAG: nuclear transport factor 2 family protein [Polyangiaceae bacterium]|nr:nuclear transport factor 2 family protein [Polyangiaceae bacterium]
MSSTRRPKSQRTLLIPLLALVACGGDGAPQAGSSASSGTSARPASSLSASSASAPGSASQVPKPAEDDSAARAVLKAWLDAQNAGDFATYEGLYAAKFEGVKRSGARTTRLDRKGWLADRKRMFDKKMVVEADDVSVVRGAGVASVRFTQTWSSGAFKDQGPKELVLVPDSGKLKVVREELFQSNVATSSVAPPLDAQRHAFVIDAGGPRVVLETKTLHEWRAGALQIVKRDDPWIVRAEVDEPKLPDAIKAWRGKELRLFGAGGEACVATVSGFSFIGRARPHFGTVATWKGLDPGGQTPGKPATDAVIAEEVFDLSYGHEPGGRMLTADLKVKSGDCKGALWARDAALAVPAVAKGEPAPNNLRDKALEAFRKLPDYAPLDAAYAKEVPAPRAARWEEHDKAAPPRVWSYRFDKQRFVGVSASTQTGGCGGFWASLSAMYEVQGDEASPRLILIGTFMVPESMADVDGEGLPELIGPEIYARSTAASWGPSQLLMVPNYDCDC